MNRVFIRVFGLCSSTILVAALASPATIETQVGSLPAPGGGESALVTLRGNTRPEANAANDRGRVADGLMLNHMMLQLKRTPAQEAALDQFIDEIHNPKSPLFHHWITAAEFGQRYGVAPASLSAVTNWLQSQGFKVNVVYPNHMVIDFSGSAGQVRRAFHTEIHHLLVKGVPHIANMTDPQIPTGLAPTVAGIVSLHDFRPHPMLAGRRPKFTTASGYYLVVPADLATIYNFNPAFAAGYSGQGQTIVVVEDTDLYTTADWSTFRSVLGLASAYPAGSLSQVHPPSSGTNNCSDPGINADDAEAAIDVEWASAGAPSAAIEMASCSDTMITFGGFIALQNILNASGTPPAIVSISYGESESLNGATSNLAISNLYQQAVTAGVSVFVSSGDEGAASSDAEQPYALNGITVSAFASTPYNVAVGGTDFADTYQGTNTTYWSSANSSNYGSALSYVPEIPWNDSCGSVLIGDYLGVLPTYGSNGLCNNADDVSTYGLLTTASGSGGPSGCATGTPSTPGVVSGTCAGYAKPSWQSGFIGVQSDGVRDLPDVSLFAANGSWSHYYVVCYSDASNGGTSCSGTPDTWAGYGGTSVSSPIMAAIQSLMNQASGSRAGNPNPTYYSLAATEYGSTGNSACNSALGNAVASSCIFYDITQIPLLYGGSGSGGDMDVPCTYYDSTHIYNCYNPGGTSSNGIYGVLSTSNTAYQPAYGNTTGWDFANGIGSVNASNLIATVAPGAAALSPTSVAFGIQPLNTSSSAQNLTLTNTGLGTLTLNSFTITGGNSGDFSVTETCSGTLAAGNSCTLKPTFKPTAAGPRKALLSVSDSAGNTPQTSILTGVGTAASLSPASLPFGNQGVGTSSSAKTVTLKNLGSATMHLWQIAIGGTNAGDFSKTTTCGATLAASATCTVSVTFKPTATGARSASLLFSNDGGGSPQAVALTGTGT